MHIFYSEWFKLGYSTCEGYSRHHGKDWRPVYNSMNRRERNAYLLHEAQEICLRNADCSYISFDHKESIYSFCRNESNFFGSETEDIYVKPGIGTFVD